jgi:polysaccharide export outer membrane protein
MRPPPILAAPLIITACAWQAPAPQAPSALGPPPPYRVQVGDQLALRFFLTPELNEDVTVRPDGRITTTIAEAVPAAGRTPEDVAGTLRTAYAAELRDPRITVEVKSAAPLRIYVAGEVTTPGEITSAGPAPTLLQVIAKAGGLKISGDPTRILIIRHTENDRPQIFAANYRAAATGQNPTADVPLQPFDIVVVPRTDIAQIYVWVNQHIQQFVPVNWGFSYNLDPIVSGKP